VTTILAFDTSTSFGAVCALTPDRRARAARAGDLLEAVDRLVDDPATIEGIVVGTGPGSFTSIRIGLAVARTLSSTLRVPAEGVSTLLAYDLEHVRPVIDAKRGEVFTDVWNSDGPEVAGPGDLDVRGQTLVGDGAIKYRDIFESNGAAIPPDDDPVHLPDPLRLVERVGGTFGGRDSVRPLYLREPDAKPSA
jgi:tRNA threonylcarbamoyladenosine biosynthesis protein TsaB